MKKRVYLFMMVFAMILFPSSIFAKTISVNNEDELLEGLNSYQTGDTIELNNDIDYTTDNIIDIKKELNIDLNGHNLTYNFSSDKAFNIIKSEFSIRNSGKTGEFNLVNTYASTGSYAFNVDGILVFSDVDINYTSKNTSYMIYVVNGAFYTDQVNLSLNEKANSLIINYVKNDKIRYGINDTNIYIRSKVGGTCLSIGNAELKLNNVLIKSEISIAFNAIAISGSSDVEISGNSIIDLSSIKDKTIYGIKTNNNSDNGSVITINNVIIKTNDKSTSYNIYGSGAKWIINDGEFYNKVAVSENTITAGKYKVAPSAQFIKEGKVFKLNENSGFYEVVDGKYEARINNIGYFKISDAINDVKENKKTTITIMSDIEEITIPKGKNIVLNNKSRKKVKKVINNGTLTTMYNLESDIINNGTINIKTRVGSVVNDGILNIQSNGVISGHLTNNSTITKIDKGIILGEIINNGTISEISGGSFKYSSSIKKSILEGYHLYKTKDSSYGDLETVYKDDLVESVSNGYYYTSYKVAAANATKENPAKLLKDIKKTSSEKYTSGTYYLDLNEHVITFTGEKKSNPQGIEINGAKLYLSGKGTINYTGNEVMFYVRGTDNIFEQDHTKLVIGENVTVNALNAIGVAMYTSLGKDKYGVNVTIDGRINAVTSLYVNGQYEISNENGPVFNITKTAKLNGTIYASGYATWNIEGNVTGSSAIYIKTGILNVTDGIITGTGEKSEYKYDGNGYYATGDALVVDNSFSTSPVINITGGTFNSTNASAVGSYAYNKETGLADNSLALTKLLKGGNYNTDISNLIADNYYYRVENNRWYVEAYDRDIEINVIEENKKVDEITIGVTSREEAKDIIISSIESNEELKDVIANKNVDIKVEVDAITPSDEVKENIISKLNKDSKIIGYFDISIGIYEKNSNTKIGNLKELNDKMNITIALPSEYQNTNKKYNRTYYIIREHDGVYESIPAVVSSDGLYVTFKTDKFSTYAAAYTDTLNPQTSDDILLYTALSIICLSGLLLAYKYRKNFNN